MRKQTLDARRLLAIAGAACLIAGSFAAGSDLGRTPPTTDAGANPAAQPWDHLLTDKMTQEEIDEVIEAYKLRFGGGDGDLDGLRGPPANDFCENAELISITSGGSAQVIGNNATATDDPGFPACGLSASGASGHLGLWYEFVGTGNTVTISLCNGPALDLALRVFCNGCTEPLCADADDDSCPAPNGLGPTLSFCTAAGTEYRVLLGRFGTTGLGGNFTMDVTDDGVPCNTAPACVAVPPPANDLCVDAIDVGPIPPLGTVSVTGDTSSATLDIGTPTCNAVTVVAPGVWYTFTGNGNVIRVSTCNPGTLFNTKLSVYSGGCAGLACIAANSDAGAAACTPADRAVVNVCTTPETTYHVLVHGSAAASVGAFELSFTDTDASGGIPTNDTCDGALALSVPPGGSVSAIGATSCATADAGLPVCGTTYTAPGVWYTFTGTGNLMSVSTCSPVRDYDTKINIFSGGCAALTCIGGNDDGPAGFCAPESPVRSSFLEFCTAADEPYHLLVQGFSGATGNFEITLSDGVSCAPPANDECETAAAIACDPSGTTLVTVDNRFATQNATDPDLSCGGVGFGTVWFTFVAGSADLTAGTCDYTVIEGNDDTLLALYDGTCGSLVELACDDDSCTTPTLGSSISFSGLAVGNTYYLELISFSAAEQGIYQLTLVNPCIVGGDDCNENGTPDADEIAANPALDCFDRDAAPIGGFNTKGGPNDVLDACECAADWNRDGVVGSSDITAFLASWFNDLSTAELKADFDCSGVTGSSDITAFLNRWFQNLSGQPPFNGCGE
ncbi:MAG: hypothetical protein H7Y88_03540 [Phycisphaerales bacterium]|nr:hypothetical protein [Phycisphaerales bacterium]